MLLSLIKHQYTTTFRFQAFLAFTYLIGYIMPLVYIVQYHSERTFVWVALGFITATLVFLVDVLKLRIYA